MRQHNGTRADGDGVSLAAIMFFCFLVFLLNYLLAKDNRITAVRWLFVDLLDGIFGPSLWQKWINLIWEGASSVLGAVSLQGRGWGLWGGRLGIYWVCFRHAMLCGQVYNEASRACACVHPSVCVCVCVCVRQRRGKGKKGGRGLDESVSTLCVCVCMHRFRSGGGAPNMTHYSFSFFFFCPWND